MTGAFYPSALSGGRGPGRGLPGGSIGGDVGPAAVSIAGGVSPPAAGSRLYNVLDYGAVGGNSTRDTLAFLAALTAATASKGTVYAPSLSTPYLTNATLTIPDGVSLIGEAGGGSIIQADAAAAPFGPMVQTAIVAGFGNRYGVMRDLRLDGNRIATVGVFTREICVQRYFENINVRNCTSIGWRIASAQNCSFFGCSSEENGGAAALDCNWLLDLGAGNNVFVNCQSNVTEGVANRGQYNLVIRQSGASPGGAFAQPELNVFVGCQFERSAISFLGAVLQRAGRNNRFIGCTIQTTGARRAVTVERTDAVTSSLLGLSGTRLSGDLATSIAVSVTTADTPGLSLEGPCLMENFATGFEVADVANVELHGFLQSGAVTDLVLPTGADTDPGLLIQRILRIDGAPSNATGAPPGVANMAAHLYDGTNHRHWIYFGAWRHVAVDELTSPAALALGNNNDYNPGTATVMRLTPNAGASTITGLSGGIAMRRIRIFNLGAANVTLAHQDANSAAANRLLSPTGAAIVLGQDDVADLEYDSGTQRWRIVNVHV